MMEPYKPERTKEEWDKIMKMSEAKQARMHRSVALNNSAQIMAAICHARNIDKDAATWIKEMTIELAKEFEKYLKGL